MLNLILNPIREILNSFLPTQQDWNEYDDHWDDYCFCCDPEEDPEDPEDPDDIEPYLIHEEEHITDLI